MYYNVIVYSLISLSLVSQASPTKIKSATILKIIIKGTKNNPSNCLSPNPLIFLQTIESGLKYAS